MVLAPHGNIRLRGNASSTPEEGNVSQDTPATTNVTPGAGTNVNLTDTPVGGNIVDASSPDGTVVVTSPPPNPTPTPAGSRADDAALGLSAGPALLQGSQPTPADSLSTPEIKNVGSSPLNPTPPFMDMRDAVASLQTQVTDLQDRLILQPAPVT